MSLISRKNYETMVKSDRFSGLLHLYPFPFVVDKQWLQYRCSLKGTHTAAGTAWAFNPIPFSVLAYKNSVLNDNTGTQVTTITTGS